MWLSARWGGAFTPILVALVLAYTSWRWTFVIFGALGVVWAAIFFRWYRDDPARHPGVNDAERAILPKAEDVTLGHAGVPWKRLALSPRVWLLWAQYTCLGYGWVFYITWLPTYLKEARGLELGKGALLTGLPLFFGGLGSLLCGSFSPALDRLTGNARISRRLLSCTGFLGAAACLVLSIRIEDPVWAMAAMGVAGFANDLAMPPSWGACMDMGGKFCGTLSGSMNMMTNLGQAVAPVATAVLLFVTAHEWTTVDVVAPLVSLHVPMPVPLPVAGPHNWEVVFYVSACAYVLGAVCWLFLDSVTPLELRQAGEPE
jgi:sugar phosphate permease